MPSTKSVYNLKEHYGRIYNTVNNDIMLSVQRQLLKPLHLSGNKNVIIVYIKWERAQHTIIETKGKDEIEEERLNIIYYPYISI